ncbi:MAG: hypothetical protein QNJ63_19105 [Calothrix sp. MO_192.B10]|nr:hypothetical protein [Calothrix sp. MO_192.B10]
MATISNTPCPHHEYLNTVTGTRSHLGKPMGSGHGDISGKTYALVGTTPVESWWDFVSKECQSASLICMR